MIEPVFHLIGKEELPDLITEGVCLTDFSGNIHYTNKRFQEWFYKCDQKNIQNIFGNQIPLDNLFLTSLEFHYELDGYTYYFEVRHHSLPGSNLFLFIDISDSKKIEEALMESERRFHDALENLRMFSMQLDIYGCITYCNPYFLSVTGYSLDSTIGQDFFELFNEKEDAAKERELFEKGIQTNKIISSYESYIITNTGEKRHVIWNNSILLNQRNEIIGINCIGEDITDVKLKEEKIKYLAYFDQLTCLPNRVRFSEILEASISKCIKNGTTLAIYYIDLDNFKIINDSLGHYVGDYFLKAMAAHLTSVIEDGETIARLGGDEFIFLKEHISCEDDIHKTAIRLSNAICKPILYEEKDYYFTASTGITLAPVDGLETDSLIRNADIAMYRAKDFGKNNYQIYNKMMNSIFIQRMEIEQHLREAIINNEVFPFYQPRVDARTGRIVSMEALVRWRKPDGSYMDPSVFIPVAESSGLIHSLGEKMLLNSCIFARRILDSLNKRIKVSVNISVRQMEQTGMIVGLRQILHQTKLPVELIELEITESGAMHNVTTSATFMNELSHMGISCSIDDFGTGYSSLSYLSSFNFQCIKIDRTFILRIPEELSIVRAIIAIGKSMNKNIVAEGVESYEQFQYLQDLGCDEIQGFYFSPPISENEIFQMLERHDTILPGNQPSL